MTFRVGVTGISETIASCSGQVNLANLRSLKKAFSSSKLSDAPFFNTTKHAARIGRPATGAELQFGHSPGLHDAPVRQQILKSSR